LEENSLLPPEQEVYQSGSKESKDQLLISKTKFENCKRRKNLDIAWTNK
jgi:hypothetical protein